MNKNSLCVGGGVVYVWYGNNTNLIIIIHIRLHYYTEKVMGYAKNQEESYHSIYNIWKPPEKEKKEKVRKQYQILVS